MKVNTNIKAGVLTQNHNEKMIIKNDGLEQKKDLNKKLRLNKETVRILKDSDLRAAVGGRQLPTSYCTETMC